MLFAKGTPVIGLTIVVPEPLKLPVIHDAGMVFVSMTLWCLGERLHNRNRRRSCSCRRRYGEHNRAAERCAKGIRVTVRNQVRDPNSGI